MLYDTIIIIVCVWVGGGGGSQRSNTLKKCKRHNWNFQRGGDGGGGLEIISFCGGGMDSLRNHTFSQDACIYLLMCTAHIVPPPPQTPCQLWYKLRSGSCLSCLQEWNLMKRRKGFQRVGVNSCLYCMSYIV